MTTAKPLARYGAIECALARGFATAELHHATGRDLVRKLSRFVTLSPQELHCLDTIQSNPQPVPAKTDIVHEGQTGHRAYILQSGWAYSYKLLREGTQQIVNFSVPGDFMGMRSILLRTSDHSFATLTDAVTTSISVPRLIRIFTAFPRLGAAMLWAVSRDEAIAVEHLVGIGRRNAIERVAHFYLELWHRLQLVGLAGDFEFACPLNQYLLSDALGLTAIHVNRVLRRLREMNLLTIREGQVVINDKKGLIKLAGYDAGYLDQSFPWEDTMISTAGRA